MEDGGDLDFSGDFAGGCSMDSFFDEILKADGAACTHTHTCNPPVGPDPAHHTHTCFHVHTKILPSSPSADSNSGDGKKHRRSSKKRPFGNREAVRKYREKKKARAASLEDEAAQLRALNQQLMRRLQNQAALEAEVARLRCLLIDIRGRIEGEIGSFPYQKSPMPMAVPPSLNVVLDSCENLRCGDQMYCVDWGPGGWGRSGAWARRGAGSGMCSVWGARVRDRNSNVATIKGFHAATKT